MYINNSIALYISCVQFELKIRYLLLFTLMGSCGCSNLGSDYKYSAKYNAGVDDYKAFENDDDDKYYNRDLKNDDNRYREHVVGLENDDKEDIVRPCSLDDWQCIRKFFAKNSQCKPMYGPVPDPLYFERNTVYYPFANITVVLNKLRVKGIANAKISEFYVNKNTGNLVFAIDFKDLNETSPNFYFRYKRTAKESIALNDFYTVQFSSGTFTAVIPKVPHLRLDLAEVHADIDQTNPPFVVGPRSFNSTDPDVITGFARLLSDTALAIQEGFLFQAQLFTAIYIQKNICDFGLKLISI